MESAKALPPPRECGRPDRCFLTPIQRGTGYARIDHRPHIDGLCRDTSARSRRRSDHRRHARHGQLQQGRATRNRSSANRQTGIPHFESKYEVEKHIAKVGVRATILAPVSFMENLYFAKEQLAKGTYAAALPPARALAQVAVADIGKVAVRVLEDAA